MAKISFAFLALSFFAPDLQLVGKEADSGITFEIASGKDKGKLFIEYRFLDDKCVFWEYFRSNAYQGSLIDENSRYKVSSLVFSFEYPKPYSSFKQFQGDESLSRYQGITHIWIGREKLKVHKFLVLEGAGKQTIYLSDSYLMPVGYDTRKVRVRITEEGLNNLRKVRCNSDN